MGSLELIELLQNTAKCRKSWPWQRNWNFGILTILGGRSAVARAEIFSFEPQHFRAMSMDLKDPGPYFQDHRAESKDTESQPA